MAQRGGHTGGQARCPSGPATAFGPRRPCAPHPLLHPATPKHAPLLPKRTHTHPQTPARHHHRQRRGAVGAAAAPRARRHRGRAQRGARGRPPRPLHLRAGRGRPGRHRRAAGAGEAAQGGLLHVGEGGRVLTRRRPRGGARQGAPFDCPARTSSAPAWACKQALRSGSVEGAVGIGSKTVNLPHDHA